MIKSCLIMLCIVINDILSQIRKDSLKPKCVTTYIHFLSTPRCS